MYHAVKAVGKRIVIIRIRPHGEQKPLQYTYWRKSVKWLILFCLMGKDTRHEQKYNINLGYEHIETE